MDHDKKAMAELEILHSTLYNHNPFFHFDLVNGKFAGGLQLVQTSTSDNLQPHLMCLLTTAVKTPNGLGEGLSGKEKRKFIEEENYLR